MREATLAWGRRNPLLVLYICIFIDLFSVGIIVPLFPYYVYSLGADAKVYGMLISIYGIAQLVGSPIMGRISDTYGRKAVFLITHAGAGIGYLMTGLSFNIWMLILSRIPVGLVKQTMSVSKAYISDISDESTRAQHIGFISTAAGVGFVVAPVVGGFISSYGEKVPAIVSSALFAVDFIFVYFVMPETHVKKSSPNYTQQSNSFALFSKPSFDFGEVVKLFRAPIIGTLLITHLFTALSITLFRSNFAVYAKDQFQLDAKHNGFIMSYVGVVEVITQTFAIGFLSKRFTESQLIFGGCVAAMLSLVSIAFISEIEIFLVCLIPMLIGNSISNTCITSSLTKNVKREEVGITIGISDSLESLGRIVSPTIGGILMDRYGYSSPSLVGSLMLAVLSTWLYVKLPVVSSFSSGAKISVE